MKVEKSAVSKNQTASLKQKPAKANRKQQESDFAEYVFLDGKDINLALTMKYLGEDFDYRDIINHEHFNTVAVPDPCREDGPVFIKVGGYKADGTFGYFYAILWDRRTIFSSEIQLSDGKIKFLSPNVMYCTSYNKHPTSSTESKAVSFSLGKDAIELIKQTCDRWDELFCVKHNALIIQDGQSKKSIGLSKVDSGVWGRSSVCEPGGIDEIIDVQFHWPFTVAYQQVVSWNIGQKFKARK